MQTAVAVVSRDPLACWRAFVDASTFAAWVPGVRRARVVQTDPAGLPTEIVFEHGESRTYSLAYTYDHEHREVRWEPRSNKRDAVAGFARFEADEESNGTRITYGLANHAGGDVEVGELTALLEGFARYMNRRTG